MNKVKRLGFGIALLALTAFSSACSHSIHLVHTGGFDARVKPGVGKVIQARSEQFNIMGFKFDTLYVEEARRELLAQCPNGQIEGITTQYSTSHGFFSWTNKILMKGICIPRAG